MSVASMSVSFELVFCRSTHLTMRMAMEMRKTVKRTVRRVIRCDFLD